MPDALTILHSLQPDGSVVATTADSHEDGKAFHDAAIAGGVNVVHLHLVRANGEEEHHYAHDPRTNAGAIAIANQISGTSQPAPFTFIALSSDTTAVAATDTVLTSEYTTGGLSRTNATMSTPTTPASLGGTTTYTLTVTYTVSATSYTIWKLGLFNAASAGTMLFETKLGTSIAGGSGDSVNVTWTVNA